MELYSYLPAYTLQVLKNMRVVYIFYCIYMLIFDSIELLILTALIYMQRYYQETF